MVGGGGGADTLYLEKKYEAEGPGCHIVESLGMSDVRPMIFDSFGPLDGWTDGC